MVKRITLVELDQSLPELVHKAFTASPEHEGAQLPSVGEIISAQPSLNNIRWLFDVCPEAPSDLELVQFVYNFAAIRCLSVIFRESSWGLCAPLAMKYLIWWLRCGGSRDNRLSHSRSCDYSHLCPSVAPQRWVPKFETDKLKNQTFCQCLKNH